MMLKVKKIRTDHELYVTLWDDTLEANLLRIHKILVIKRDIIDCTNDI